MNPGGEKLDRGVVALAKDRNEVYVGWRLFSTDPKDVGFNIYRMDIMKNEYEKVNDKPIVNSTNYVDKVMEVIDKVGQDLAKNKDYKDFIINPLHVLGLDDFGESGLIFKVLGKTKAQKQWRVKREFRRCLKIEFDKEGIEIPYPHRVIIEKKKK